MTWTQSLKRVTPPILVDAVRQFRTPPRIWDGVYAHRRDVPPHRDDYGGELTDEAAALTSAALSEVKAGSKPALWHEPFALVAGALAASLSTLRVLDFGGATGSGYVQLLSSLPKTARRYYASASALIASALFMAG